MYSHVAGMDTCISPAGGMDADGVTKNLCQGGFNDFLYSEAVGLNLPTSIGSTVILYVQKDCAHLNPPTSKRESVFWGWVVRGPDLPRVGL